MTADWSRKQRGTAIGLAIVAAVLVFRPDWLAGISAGDQMAWRMATEGAMREKSHFLGNTSRTYVACRAAECEQLLNMRIPHGVYLWIESDGETFVSRAMHPASPSVWVWEKGAEAPHREAATRRQYAERAAFIDQMRAPEPTPVVDVTHLVEALRDGNELDRMRAGIEFRRLGPSAAAALPDLIEMLNTQEPSLMAALGNALTGIGPKAAVPALVEALHHPDRELAAAAAYNIGAFGRSAGPAIPALLEALRDPTIRDGASAALEQIEAGD